MAEHSRVSITISLAILALAGSVVTAGEAPSYFKLCDKDSDGKLSKAEFTAACT